MKAEILKSFPYIELTGLAAILFVGLFVSMLIWINLPSSIKNYKRIEKLPLE